MLVQEAPLFAAVVVGTKYDIGVVVNFTSANDEKVGPNKYGYENISN